MRINTAASPYNWVPMAGFYRPAVDQTLVTGDLFQLAGNGSYNTNATIMWGFTRDDAGGFTAMYNLRPLPPQDFNATKSYFPGLSTALFANASSLYPIDTSNPDAVRSMLSDAATDWFFRCPLLNVTKSLATHSRVYNFQFNYGRDMPPVLPMPANPFCRLPQRVCHATDVIPSFGSANYFFTYPQTGVDARFARQIVDRFTTLAKTGTPNPTPDQPGYERFNMDVVNVTISPYTATSANTVLFQATGGNVTQDLKKAQCDYIEQNQPYLFEAYKP
ncbi:hypothetical protein BGZ73_008911 [Actinomortierella ambigua]|nr:hypothetical protein BGZ73_008911 [Actinomortierella ambigua]